MDEPLVSIITVTYNLIKSNRKESFLRAVDSVKKQKYLKVEHIIVDGGSDDGTLDLIKNTGLNYISEPDNGIYDAMTKGIKLASGEYIFFLNSDDYLFDNSVVATIVNAFKENDCEAICGNIVPYLLCNQERNTHLFKIGEPNRGNPLLYKNKLFLIIDNIHHQSMFYKKKLFIDSSFFNEDFPNGSDWLFNCMTFLQYNNDYLYIDKNIAYFGLGGFSTNATDDELLEEYLNMREIMQARFGKYIDKTNKYYIKYIEKNKLKKIIYRIKNISIVQKLSKYIKICNILNLSKYIAKIK